MQRRIWLAGDFLRVYLDVFRTPPSPKNRSPFRSLHFFPRAFNLCLQSDVMLVPSSRYVSLVCCISSERRCRDTPWLAEEIETIIWRLYCCASLQQFQTHFTSARTDCRKSVKIIGFHFFREVMSFLDFSASPCINFRRRLKRNCVPKCNSILPPAENRFAVNKLEASPSKQVESLFFN